MRPAIQPCSQPIDQPIISNVPVRSGLRCAFDTVPRTLCRTVALAAFFPTVRPMFAIRMPPFVRDPVFVLPDSRRSLSVREDDFSDGRRHGVEQAQDLLAVGTGPRHSLAVLRELVDAPQELLVRGDIAVEGEAVADPDERSERVRILA